MIHNILRNSALGVALLAIALGGCKNDNGDKPATSATSQLAKEAATPPSTPTPEPTKSPAAESEDYFYVEISHAEPKPDDPVKISFPEVRVVASSIDLDNLEASSAELEVGMTTLDSGIPKRDGHLASPDYFDTASFATASIKVKNVKAKDDKTFTATSEVTVRGVTKSWPVEFSIVATSGDSMTIEAEHSFSRLDFEVGKADGDSAANEVSAKLRVTLPTAAG